MCNAFSPPSLMRLTAIVARSVSASLHLAVPRPGWNSGGTYLYVRATGVSAIVDTALASVVDACSVMCTPLISAARICSVAAPSALQRLRLEELLEPVAAELTTKARLAVTAERGDGVELAAVDHHAAGPQLAGDPVGPLVVGRPHRAGESVARVVGDVDRIVIVVVRDERQHGPEDLLLGDSHVRIDCREDCRLHEIAAVEPRRRLD